MNRRATGARLGATAAVAALIVMAGVAPAAAADGDVAVVNTETVQVYMSPTGEVRESRIYEQLSFTGQGSVSVENPVSGNGVRNLDEFGGFDVEDGSQRVEVEVEGRKRLRGVSEYDDELPLEVDVRYRLDGEPVEPGDVVGESGELEVQYRVENVTGEMQEISFDDGRGNTITKSAEVVIPMVGSLSTTLPSTFTDVRSDEANQAGDGRGGTKLSFTMTLFEPIGSSVAEFGYTATITDGVVPRATIAALPVNPLESPSFKGGAASYHGGAETGAELAAGGQEIDANLLKLRDGAGDLLAGLIQLRNGSQQLSDGLNTEAGPGSVRLADGAGELAAGLGLLQDGGALLASKMGDAESGAAQLAEGSGRLASGLGQIEDGSALLSAGGKDAVDGAGRLAHGAGQLAHGLGRLGDGSARLAQKLGEAEGGAQRLAGGSDELATGMRRLEAGSSDLMVGSDTAADGAARLADGAQSLADGLHQAELTAPALLAGLQEVKGGLERVDAGLVQMYAAVGGLPDKAKPLHEGIAQLVAGIGTKSTTGSLLYGVDKVRSGLGDAVSGLQAIKAKLPASYQRLDCAVKVLEILRNGGLLPTCANAPLPELAPDDRAIAGLVYPDLILGLAAGRDGLFDPNEPDTRVTLYGGLSAIEVGLDGPEGAIAALTRIECGLSNESLPSCSADVPGLLEGVQALDAGVSQLVGGVVTQVQGGIGGADDVPADGTLRGGVNGLQDGVDEIAAGGGTLLAGLSQLSDGADQVASGSGDLNAGLDTLSAGAGRLADGTADASSGAELLAGGSDELLLGLGLLGDGADALADGAEDAEAGSRRVADGSDELFLGLGALRDGIVELARGADEASTGADRLEAGNGELFLGLGLLLDGAQALAAGAGDAADGGVQVADGAEQLADGLGDAATGSAQITEGLRQAAGGAPKLVDGAQRLSDEGTTKLVDAGASTAREFGEKYALIEAGAERAQSEAMVFGAPEGAAGAAAFTYELVGDDGETGRNWTRGVAAVIIFGLGAGLMLLRRGRV